MEGCERGWDRRRERGEGREKERKGRKKTGREQGRNRSELYKARTKSPAIVSPSHPTNGTQRLIFDNCLIYILLEYFSSIHTYIWNVCVIYVWYRYKYTHFAPRYTLIGPSQPHSSFCSNFTVYQTMYEKHLSMSALHTYLLLFESSIGSHHGNTPNTPTFAFLPRFVDHYLNLLHLQ